MAARNDKPSCPAPAVTPTPSQTHEIAPSSASLKDEVDTGLHVTTSTTDASMPVAHAFVSTVQNEEGVVEDIQPAGPESFVQGKDDITDTLQRSPNTPDSGTIPHPTQTLSLEQVQLPARTISTSPPNLPLPTSTILPESLPFVDTTPATTQPGLIDPANLGSILNPLPLEDAMNHLDLLSGPINLLPLDVPVPLPSVLSDLASATPTFPDTMWHLLPPDQQTVSGSLGELSHPPLSEVEPVQQPPEGFARLDFPDGQFYMTTYAVELGRDMKAFKLARQHAMETQIDHDVQRARSQSIDQPPQTPMRPPRSTGPASVARSFVSESGGIIGEDDAHINFGKRRRRKSKKSKSPDSQDSQILRKNHPDRPESNGRPIVPATVDPNVTARLDPSAHMGDPHHIPRIPIHPANLFNDGSNTGKGISRKHIKIAYNFDTATFEMHVQGKNGAFHDNDYCGPGTVVALHDRSVIQVAGVDIKFVLPNTMNQDDQLESCSVSRMSFAFEDEHGEVIVHSDIEEPYSDGDDFPTRASEEGLSDELLSDSDDLLISDDDDLLIDHSQDDEDDNEDEEEAEDEEEEQVETPIEPTARIRFKTKDPQPKEPARRGRPPKSHAKPAVKIKLKLGKITAEDSSLKKEKIRTKDEKKESPPADAKKSASKTISRGPAKSAIKTAMKATSTTIDQPLPSPTIPAELPAEIPKADEDVTGKDVEAPVVSIEVTDGPVAIDGQDKDKENDKPKDDTPKEPKAVRVARDEPILNGEGVNIADLPAGFVLPPRKKGPGRPPKDGIMSKREKALLIKQIKQEEQARRMGIDISQLPRPEPRPRPPPRRNSKGEVIESESQDKDGDGDKTKIIRPPRSPSPEIRIEDYTEEQLQRPQCNYVILIHEAIKNSKTGALNLQQIYSAIERRWPFFKFRTTSNGWQSSVRHNLGQHPAFKQVEKDGKGWLWGINDGVPIERERKKKATPPPQPIPNPHAQYPYGSYPVGAPRPPGPMPTYKSPMGVPPRTFGPPATGLNGQSYASPYTPSTAATTANGTQPVQPPHQYAPGQYANRLQNSAVVPGQQQPPTRTPPMPATLSGARFNPPSQDLIDTFRRVFIGTAQKQKDGMDLQSATRIVDNAIRRVLHPEQMTSIQAEQNELSVAKAFETCLTRAQGPVKRATPATHATHNSAQHHPHTSANNNTMPPRPGTSIASPGMTPGQATTSHSNNLGGLAAQGLGSLTRPSGAAGVNFTNAGPGPRPLPVLASPGNGPAAGNLAGTGPSGVVIASGVGGATGPAPTGVIRQSMSPAHGSASGPSTTNGIGSVPTTAGSMPHRSSAGASAAPVASTSSAGSSTANAAPSIQETAQTQRPIGQNSNPAPPAFQRNAITAFPLSSGSVIPPSPFAQVNRPSQSATPARPGIAAPAAPTMNSISARLPVTNPPPPMNMNRPLNPQSTPQPPSKIPSPMPQVAASAIDRSPSQIAAAPPPPNTAPAAALAALSSSTPSSTHSRAPMPTLPSTAPLPPPQITSPTYPINRPTTPAAISVLTKLSGLPDKMTDKTTSFNGTLSPLRPVVEPLTPPPTVAGAESLALATSDVAAGVKRKLEALGGGSDVDGVRDGLVASAVGDEEVKRRKVEV